MIDFQDDLVSVEKWTSLATMTAVDDFEHWKSCTYNDKTSLLVFDW